MTELEKCYAGLPYRFDDPEMVALKKAAIRECERFNSIDGTDNMAQHEQLKRMLGSVGEHIWIGKTFNCDRGKNIYIGNNFTGNHNLTILDIREVRIGDNVMIGPHTLITTVSHPLSPEERREAYAWAKPVTICDDVWIGGNVTILPGVTIGKGAVIGAGAVVTTDIPARCVAVGSPAHVVKEIG
ncbi:MAG: sugar O-acetyltransferase [Bacteroidales bacterium]|nr:sugar O-acetyltransferase [Bacteroidales bacterium]